MQAPLRSTSLGSHFKPHLLAEAVKEDQLSARGQLRTRVRQLQEGTGGGAGHIQHGKQASYCTWCYYSVSLNLLAAVGRSKLGVCFVRKCKEPFYE